ncbi:MAG TPA: FHA domain-containing protein [Gammaproteobacteria bacterium]|nr:FHA domain-containing protein [Gammaproteobacteria bacterium]
MAELIQYANGVPGIRFRIDKPVIRIGRSEIYNDICVADAYVSKEHALIEARPAEGRSEICEFFIHDLGSTNKTYVNKKMISTVRLKNNDMLYVGRNMFRFICSENEVMIFPEVETDFHVSSQTLEIVSNDSSQLRPGFSRRLRVLGAESLLD